MMTQTKTKLLTKAAYARQSQETAPVAPLTFGVYTIIFAAMLAATLALIAMHDLSPFWGLLLVPALQQFAKAAIQFDVARAKTMSVPNTIPTMPRTAMLHGI